MALKTYIRRTLKYALYLLIILAILLTAMDLMGASQSPSTLDLIFTERGAYMAVVVIIFAAIYPFMGYVKKTLLCNASERSEQVVNIMAMCGYKLVSTEGTEMTFRAATFAKKLILLFEDTIVITTSTTGTSEMRGPRREVVRAAFRLGTFVQ